MNITKLAVRGVLFLLGVSLYILSRIRPEFRFSPDRGSFPAFFGAVWVIYVGEMIYRCFPGRLESMGCMKQLRRNYRPVENAPVPDTRAADRTMLKVAAVWILFNGLIGAAYFLRWIDKGILLLISLAYGVCDVICILFFCPFQTWFMKNRCCVVCHIYNWDFIMLCTPLFFMPGWFEWSMLGCSIAMFLRWQITRSLHPERFYEESNEALRCANCTEKLCTHKRHLQRFLKKQLREHWEKIPALQELAGLTERRDHRKEHS